MEYNRNTLVFIIIIVIIILVVIAFAAFRNDSCNKNKRNRNDDCNDDDDKKSENNSNNDKFQGNGSAPQTPNHQASNPQTPNPQTPNPRTPNGYHQDSHQVQSPTSSEKTEDFVYQPPQKDWSPSANFNRNDSPSQENQPKINFASKKTGSKK